MFVSLFGVYHSCEDVTITDEGLQILTYARHSWPLSSERSLACHTYCDREHLFIMVISVTLTPIAERLAVELSLTVFTTKVCRGWDSNTQPSVWWANALTNCNTAAVNNTQQLKMHRFIELCTNTQSTAHYYIKISK